MRKLFFFFFWLFVPYYNSNAQDLSYSLDPIMDVPYAQMKTGFKNPPDGAKVRVYWWWLNGMATKESISRDIREMKEKGFGGAVIFDAGSSNYSVASKTEHGADFLSEEWLNLFAHAVKTADKYNFELSINIQSGWNPGGPMVTPKEAMKKIVYTKTTVTGPEEVKIELEKPNHDRYYQDVLVQAYPSSTENGNIKNWGIKSMNERLGWKGIFPLYKLQEPTNPEVDGINPKALVNLTNNFKNDTLVWKVPPGEWTIVRYGMTLTGAEVSTGSDGWEGLSYDHLSRKAFKSYFDQVVQPIINRAKEAGNSLKFLHTDSWEMGVVNWTDDFFVEFEKRRGYDMRPFMPVLTNEVVKNAQVSDRFLYDFRRTIGDLVADHYAYFAELAHANDLYIHPESGGPHSAPVDALQVMGISEVPMGEFWARANSHRVKEDERLSVKQGASAAHIYGKRWMAAEGPTSIGPQWERSPSDLKGVLDRVLTAGVNRIVWHTFTSSPVEYGKPGNEYFAGTHLNPNVTWWEQAGAFTSYLNRSTYLLSLGLFNADVLYYYGDEVPNFVFLKDEVDLDFGYDWDKTNSEVLLDRAKIANNKIRLPDGMTYSVLVLPNEPAIRLDVLKKIKSLVQEGLTVIGPRPKRAKGLEGWPESDQEVERIAETLWGDINGSSIKENHVGQGKVIYGKNVNEVLREMNISPDFSFESTQKDTELDFIHRSTDSAEIYFVVNRLLRQGKHDYKYEYDPALPDRFEMVESSFRVKEGNPEIWNPMTGEIKKPLLYRHKNGSTIVSMHLNPEGSAFVIFPKGARETEELHITSLKKETLSLFPVSGLNRARTSVPINFYENNSAIYAEVFEPGTYSLTWSTGSKQELKVENFEKIKEIKGPWKISFGNDIQKNINKTAYNLNSWTDSEIPAIKYYSGKATYRNNFDLSESQINKHNLYLDLGNMQNIAVVYLNDKKVGTTWKAPYRLDISNFVKTGKNRLRIEVVNLWANRLIGDGKLPLEERRTKTNVNKFDQPGAEKYLRKSGLLGPVELHFAKKIKVN